MPRVHFDSRPRENLTQGGAARRVRQCSMLFTIRARILRRAARLSIHYTPIARHYGSKKMLSPKGATLGAAFVICHKESTHFVLRYFLSFFFFYFFFSATLFFQILNLDVLLLE